MVEHRLSRCIFQGALQSENKNNKDKECTEIHVEITLFNILKGSGHYWY